LTIQLPAALFLLLVPLLIGVLIWRGNTIVSRRRRDPIAAALRLAAITVLILAIAQPEWHRGAAPGPLIVVVDTSASISVADRDVEIDWVRRAVSYASTDTPVDIVSFAAGATLT
jgi:hypothetical protein